MIIERPPSNHQLPIPTYVSLSELIDTALLREHIPVLFKDGLRRNVWTAMWIQIIFLSLTLVIPDSFYLDQAFHAHMMVVGLGANLVSHLLHLIYLALPTLQILAICGLFGGLYVITISRGMTTPVAEYLHIIAALCVVLSGISLVTKFLSLGVPFVFFVFNLIVGIVIGILQLLFIILAIAIGGSE